MSYSQSALEFLKESAIVLNWGDGKDSIVMDIGCGDGTNSTKCLVECLPEMEKLFGIDNSVYAIIDARFKSRHPKIEYHIADIEQRDSLNRWIGRIDKIFSNCCLGLTTHQDEAFRNVYHLLVPGGSAAITFILQAPLFDWMEEMFSRWRQFNNERLELRIPMWHLERWNANHYENNLRTLGFVVIHCEKEVHDYKQEIGDACKDYLFRACPLSPMIPEKVTGAYKDDMYHTFLRHCSKSDGGEISAKITVLNVLLKKPSEPSEDDSTESGDSNSEETAESDKDKLNISAEK